MSLCITLSVGKLHVFVAAPSLRRTFSKALRTAGGLTARSSGEIPPLPSLILPIIILAASLDRVAIDATVHLGDKAGNLMAV